jgi:hypothetical protein
MQMGTSVDNALEGALDLVQTMGEVTMRATTGIDFGELDDEYDDGHSQYSHDDEHSPPPSPRAASVSRASSGGGDALGLGSRAASGRSSAHRCVWVCCLP